MSIANHIFRGVSRTQTQTDLLVANNVIERNGRVRGGGCTIVDLGSGDIGIDDPFVNGPHAAERSAAQHIVAGEGVCTIGNTDTGHRIISATRILVVKACGGVCNIQNLRGTRCIIDAGGYRKRRRQGGGAVILTGRGCCDRINHFGCHGNQTRILYLEGIADSAVQVGIGCRRAIQYDSAVGIDAYCNAIGITIFAGRWCKVHRVTADISQGIRTSGCGCRRTKGACQANA